VRPEVVAADRQLEVRRAATLWRKEGRIDEATEGAVAALYPDDRVRTTRVFRVLFFFFTWFGFSSAYGLGSAFFLAALSALNNPSESNAFAMLSLGSGIAALVGAEFLHTNRRLRRFGVEEACVWIGISYTVGGALWTFDRLADPSIHWLVGLGAWGVAGTATLSAWRWGTPATGLLAAGALFVALTQVPLAHLAWLIVSALLAWPLAHLSVAAHVSPQGRRRFREAFLVASAALYVAIHVEVVEARLLGEFGPGGDAATPDAPPLLVTASLVAMVLIPLAYLAAGIARRYRPAIDVGLLMLLATLATFSFRARPKPEWLFLVVAGAAFLAVALTLKRVLGSRPGAEWNGLTALPIADDRGSSGAVETLATLAAFAPTARPFEERPAFEGQGGSFGGGGASAKF
jgi:hypothetical protein